MKPVRLILIPAFADDPVPWLIIGEDGLVRERGVLDPQDPADAAPLRTVAICPGVDVTVRWLDLPSGGAAQLRAAAAWALRETVAGAPEQLAVAVGRAQGPEGPRPVAVVSRAILQVWIDHLALCGLRPDIILPDMLAVPEPADESSLSAMAFGDSLALRGHRFAASVQPELADLVAGDRVVTAVEDAAALEQALISAARAPALNLLDAVRNERRAEGRWRRAGALAAAAVISPLVVILGAALRDDLVARDLASDTRAQVVGAAPDLAAATDPAAALRGKLRNAPPPGGVGAAAAALFAAVERIEGAELDILVADPGEGVKATISHPAYGDINAIRADLTRAGMATTVTGTTDEAGRVVSDITIGGL